MSRDAVQRPSAVARCVRALLAVALAAVVAVAMANIVTVVATRGSVHTVPQVAAELAAAPADAVVVLGASVHADGTPSDILADRLEVAVDLYKAGAARAVKAFCVEAGVPSEDVYVDRGGVGTYESMYRARAVFGAERIIVATQAYHLYRAMFTADCLGMETWGVACDKGAYDNQQMYSVREVMARTKDFYAARLHLPVDTVGETVSLHDSGDAS